jgi:hypothetical protein
VYKKRERIHRSIADLRLLPTPLHVGELQPTIRTEANFKGLAPDYSLATRCIRHYPMCVALDVSAMLI